MPAIANGGERLFSLYFRPACLLLCNSATLLFCYCYSASLSFSASYFSTPPVFDTLLLCQSTTHRARPALTQANGVTLKGGQVKVKIIVQVKKFASR